MQIYKSAKNAKVQNCKMTNCKKCKYAKNGIANLLKCKNCKYAKSPASWEATVREATVWEATLGYRFWIWNAIYVLQSMYCNLCRQAEKLQSGRLQSGRLQSGRLLWATDFGPGHALTSLKIIYRTL